MNQFGLLYTYTYIYTHTYVLCVCIYIIYKEMSQGNSLYSYFKQVSFFFFYRIKEQEGRKVPVSGMVSISGRGKEV
jgi:hypothetical protein